MTTHNHPDEMTDPRPADSAEPAPPTNAPTPPDPSTGLGGPASGRQAAPHSSVGHEASTKATLFADDELAELRARWTSVQAAFVDDPRECVNKADALVSNVVEQLTTGFAQARSRLEEQWARGEEASTEDLRVALTHYREFFERLLTV